SPAPRNRLIDAACTEDVAAIEHGSLIFQVDRAGLCLVGTVRDDKPRSPRALGNPGAFRKRRLADRVRVRAGPEDDKGEQGQREQPHQYVLSCGCHFVIVTGFQSRTGWSATQRTIVCFRKFSSSRSG